MDFSFTSDQRDLQRMLRDLSDDRASSAQVRAAIDTDDGYDAELWKLVSGELGLVGIAVPESLGGAGGSFVDAAIVLEESGRALWPVPLLANLVGGAALASGADAAAGLAESVATGERSVALAVSTDLTVSGETISGSVTHVVDGHRADLLVVAAPDALWLVDPTRHFASARGERSLDLTRWLATVHLEDALASRIGDAAASARAVDVLRVALAVEAVGAARACLDSTVSYLKTREQFGKPIGSFQALAHRAADLAVALESAASTAYYAAWAVADSPDEVAVVAPLAKSVCADAAYRIAAETIQMHGGIGFTWEHDSHLYFKRATLTRALLGDSHEQRKLVAIRSGIAEA
jgi:alkylation response protein AidB-like acyl-CoA dehydrogenase